jgi:hypothetical protein
LSSIRAPFEFFDFGHICGYASSVFAFTRPIATLRLGSVVVLRHVRLLCFFSVAEIGLDRKVTGVTIRAAPPDQARVARETRFHVGVQSFSGPRRVRLHEENFRSRPRSCSGFGRLCPSPCWGLEDLQATPTVAGRPESVQEAGESCQQVREKVFEATAKSHSETGQGAAEGTEPGTAEKRAVAVLATRFM